MCSHLLPTSLKSVRLLLLLPCCTCYQLLGLDYLVDEDMHPWLLEVNGTPSLAVEHGDTAVEQLIHDTKVTLQHGKEWFEVHCNQPHHTFAQTPDAIML